MKKHTEVMVSKQLLNGSEEERLNFFKHFYLIHPKLSNALNQLQNEVASKDEQKIVFLIGPPVVGKSTLLDMFVKVDAKKIYKRISLDELPGSSVSPRFTWKNYYKTCIELFGQSGESFKESRKKKDYRQLNSLVTTLGNIMKTQDLSAFLIDDAVLMFEKNDIHRQVDRLMAFTQSSNTTHVLCMQENVLFEEEVSYRLVRGIKKILLTEYDIENQEELVQFRNIIALFKTHCP